MAADVIRYMADGGACVFFAVRPPSERIGLHPFEVFRRQITLAGIILSTTTFRRVWTRSAQVDPTPGGWYRIDCRSGKWPGYSTDKRPPPG